MREKIEKHYSDEYDSNMFREIDVRKLESDYEQIENFADGVKDVIADLEYNLQLAIDGLEIFSNLKTAYPESVFPPIGNDTYTLMCKASGISVDRVSAHVLRSVTKGYAELADETIDKINKT